MSLRCFAMNRGIGCGCYEAKPSISACSLADTTFIKLI